MTVSVKCIICNSTPLVGEAGPKFLIIGAFVQVMSRILELFGRDIASLLGGELEGGPVYLVLGLLIEFIEVIATFWCTDGTELVLNDPIVLAAGPLSKPAATCSRIHRGLQSLNRRRVASHNNRHREAQSSLH